jgi:probable HAF family extracellular repeat protein
MRAADGTITTLAAPRAGRRGSTFPTAINDRGVVVGYYRTGAGVSHGFLRKPEGKFIHFDAPGATGTISIAVSPSGVVTGSYSDTSNVYVRLRARYGRHFIAKDLRTLPEPINTNPPRGTAPGTTAN